MNAKEYAKEYQRMIASGDSWENSLKPVLIGLNNEFMSKVDSKKDLSDYDLPAIFGEIERKWIAFCHCVGTTEEGFDLDGFRTFVKKTSPLIWNIIQLALFKQESARLNGGRKL